MPIPARKINTLVDQLNEIAKRGQADEFTLNRFKFEARKLLDRGNKMEGFVLLGCLACLTGNIREMHRCHKNAVQWAINGEERAYALANYAASLTMVNLYEHAIKELNEALAIDPRPEWIKAQFDNAITMGMTELAMHCKNLWIEAGHGDFPRTDAQIKSNLGAVRPEVDALIEANLKDHDEIWKRLADA